MSDDKPLTHDEWRRLLRHQYGSCALCGKESRSLELDHDHRTMLIRGLLCNDCNRSLDRYEKQRRIFQHFEKYLLDPPVKALGIVATYKPPAKERQAS